MRISDWSSDVCSSDLPDCGSQAWEKARLPCFAPLKRSASWNAGERILFVGRKPFHACDSCKPDVGHIHTALCARIGMSRTEPRPCRISRRIGRESCRERVCQYV